MVAEYEGSGLSRVEFCRKQGLSLATLARYQKRQAQGEVVAGSRWVAVDISGAEPKSRAGSGLAVTLPCGRRIEIGCGVDARAVVQLLGVLERV